MFRVVSYQDSHREQIDRLMAAPSWKSRIWEWQFQSNPFGSRFDPVVLMQDDRVAGFNGVMPVEVSCSGVRRKALWSCDFYVDRDCRGQGLGRMIKTALHERSDLIMSFGISRMAAPVLLKMGWRSSPEVHVYRKYRSPRSGRQWLALLVQAVNRLRGMSVPRQRQRLTCELSDHLPAPDRVDRLWEQVAGSYCKIVVRNHAYLHWRYEQHPLARYRFLHVFEGDRLRAIGVLRQDNGHVHLVDLLAAADDRDARHAVLAELLHSIRSCRQFSCITSDALLSSCLQARGFFRNRKQPRFFVHAASEADQHPELGWFIMGGDSDGDMLLAAREQQNLRIEQSSDPVLFRDLAEPWQEVLGRSDANRLFMGWAWQYSWWETWGEQLGLQLVLLTAYRGDRLVGIAPLYLDRVVLAGWLPVSRLQFVGNAFRRQGTVRTEYMEFICVRDDADEVCRDFAMYLANHVAWDEFVMCDVLRDSATCKAVLLAAGEAGCMDFVRVADRGIRIDTSGRFDAYLAGLGRQTRLKLYGRRSYLDTLGRVGVQRADAGNLDKCFAVLNEFHRQRWGAECFNTESLRFHKRMLQRHAGAGSYELECLTLDDEPISTIYNVTAGHTVYNLQSGFNERFDHKLSLGTLHMGLSIERAFADPGTGSFDLLAGNGKKQFYKSHFKGEIIEFTTLQIVRRRLLKMLYRLYLLFPGRSRQPGAGNQSGSGRP